MKSNDPYNLNSMEFEVNNYYNGQGVKLTDDYYSYKRAEILDFLQQNSKPNIEERSYRIHKLIEALLELPFVFKNVTKQLEEVRNSLVKEYETQVDDLTQMYQNNPQDEIKSKYGNVNMPGRVENFLKPWLERVKKTDFFSSDEYFKWQYEKFRDNSLQFIDFIIQKLDDILDLLEKIEISSRSSNRNISSSELINQELKQLLVLINVNTQSNFKIEYIREKVKKQAKNIKKIFKNHLQKTEDSTEKEKIFFQINNYGDKFKIESNISIIELIRLMYLLLHDDEQLVYKFYDFEKSKNVLPFILNYVNQTKPPKPETIKRTYRKVMKEAEDNRVWKVKKYLDHFKKTFEEFTSKSTKSTK